MFISCSTVAISLSLYCIVFALLNLVLSQQEMQLLQDMRLGFYKKVKQLYFNSILYCCFSLCLDMFLPTLGVQRIMLLLVGKASHFPGSFHKDLRY